MLNEERRKVIYFALLYLFKNLFLLNTKYPYIKNKIFSVKSVIRKSKKV